MKYNQVGAASSPPPPGGPRWPAGRRAAPGPRPSARRASCGRAAPTSIAAPGPLRPRCCGAARPRRAPRSAAGYFRRSHTAAAAGASVRAIMRSLMSRARSLFWHRRRRRSWRRRVRRGAADERAIVFNFTPTERAQIAIWIESADGTFLATVGLTQAVSVRGIGNRPGATQMNSGYHWPYGRREGVLPIWAHRRAPRPAPGSSRASSSSTAPRDTPRAPARIRRATRTSACRSPPRARARKASTRSPARACSTATRAAS